MKSILIPTDFSETANNAFLYALHLANNMEFKVFVLYAYMPPILSATHGGQPEMLQSAYEEMELSKFQSFKDNVTVLKKIATDNSFNTDNVIFLFEEGGLINSIRKTIEKEDIFAIVMGTTGASGLSQALIGSNTVDVINHIKRPVLAIPTSAKFKPTEKIAFTTLFRDKDKAALEEIVKVSRKIPFEIYCINVLNDPNYVKDVLIKSEEWAKLYDNAKIEFVFLEKEGTVEKTINKFLQENNIDTLLVVKRNKSFIDRLLKSSLSNKFVFHSHIPTWVFHEEN